MAYGVLMLNPRIYAHSVFVALKVNKIDAYIKWPQKQKYSVNYFKLANVDMPQRAFFIIVLAISRQQLYLITSCTQHKNVWDVLRITLNNKS